MRKRLTNLRGRPKIGSGKLAGSVIVARTDPGWCQSTFFGATLHPEGVLVKTRNWEPVRVVCLNPEYDNASSKSKAKRA